MQEFRVGPRSLRQKLQDEREALEVGQLLRSRFERTQEGRHLGGVMQPTGPHVPRVGRLNRPRAR